MTGTRGYLEIQGPLTKCHLGPLAQFYVFYLYKSPFQVLDALKLQGAPFPTHAFGWGTASETIITF